MHIKNIHCMVEKLAECAKCEIEKGIESVDTKEMSEAVEMIKELCEAEYYARISKAMEESEEEEKEERRYYKGQMRNSRGQYMRGGRRGYIPMYSKMLPMMYEHDDEWERDMDMQDGRMYYTDMRMNQGSGTYSNGMRSTGSMGNTGGMQSRRVPKYGYSHEEYMDAKSKWDASNPENIKLRKQVLDDYLNELVEMGKETVADMTTEEKQIWKQKISKLINL